MTSTDIYDPCHKAGGMSSYAWEDDPKRLTFTLARYKHVAKMLEGYKQVIEVGCSDGFGSRIVRQHVRYLKAIDLDQQAIEEAKIAIKNSKWWVDFECMSIYDYVFDYKYDACYCLDVFEHVPKTSEDKFLAHLHKLAPVCIVGTPSLESQKYASKLSKEGHVNCKSGSDLKKSLQKHWNHVFMFSMNDEAIGTGFLPMAHYLLALCIA